MLLLSPILTRSLESNIVNVARILVHSLNVKVSTYGIKEKLGNHPNYPSLLSISDTLSDWNVSNITFRANHEMLNKLPTPFMVQMKEELDNYFIVVKSVDSKGLVVSDKFSRKWRDITWKSFSENWSGTVTLVEPEDNAGDLQYPQLRKKEVFLDIARFTAIGIFTLIIFYTIGISIVNLEWASLQGILLLLLKVFGTYITSLLLWYEIDKNNLVINKVCKSGNKTNCDAILQSKAAKIFGLVSWSELGFVYFFGSMSFLIFNNLSLSSVALISAMSFIAFPYVLFSLFYQWRIAKQWCLLCVTVQIILTLETCLGFISNSFSIRDLADIGLANLMTIPIYFLLPLILWILIKPSFRAAKEYNRTKIAMTRLKFNNNIFESQLVGQKTIVNESRNLGLSLGNHNARNKIIKVCNPYCGPCAKAHPEIHQLIERIPDLHVQIIFTASSSNTDEKAPPVRHFLALQEQYGETILNDALSKWYSSENKNYESFASEFPVKGQLKKYNEELDAMVEWCKQNDISFTPSYFINGHALPSMYEISDLKHILS